MQPERRPLVVAAHLEPAEAATEPSSPSTSISSTTPPSSRTRSTAASMSSTRKNRYGAAPLSPPCIPPGTAPAPMVNPAPDGPVSNRHPNSPS